MKDRITSILDDLGVDAEIRCIESFPSDDTEDLWQVRVSTESGQHVRGVSPSIDDDVLESKLSYFQKFSDDR